MTCLPAGLGQGSPTMDATLQPTRTYFLFLLLIAGTGVVALACGFQLFPNTHWLDCHDIRLYYQQSRWIAGEGSLYRDILSEYPPAANLLFAAVRLVSDKLMPMTDGLTAFIFAWSWGGWLVYLAMGHLIATRVNPQALWIWFAPA